MSIDKLCLLGDGWVAEKSASLTDKHFIGYAKTLAMKSMNQLIITGKIENLLAYAPD